MKKLQEMLNYLIVLALVFYATPVLVEDTGSGMFILLGLVPLSTFLVSLVYGWLKSFSLLFPILVAALFVPTVYMFYNESALVYVAAYGVISLIGTFVGQILAARRRPKAF